MVSRSREFSDPHAPAAPTWSETDRLAALDRYAVLDTPREPEFDDIVRLAADVFEAPISVVNLIASGRQWFKAEVGIGADELPLDVSICAHALLQPGIFVVPDTTNDPRFACNPLVTGDPGLRFYAGALLNTPEGLPLGTVCVLDTKPRPEGITARQELTLEVLARQVMTQLELRRAVAERDHRADQLRSALASRHEADGALHESEERLRLATESADVGFWDVDVINNVLIWPARVKAMFGISADVPVTMQDFYDGLHPDDHIATGVAFAGAADPERRALYDVEYRTIGKEDGLIRWIAAKGRGLFDDQGRCTRVIGTAIDITARKWIEGELRELNATLEMRVAERTADRDRIWRLSTEVMLVASLDGTINAVNPAWERLLGWKSPELLGSNFMELVHPEDQAATTAEVGRLGSGATTFRFENRYRASDGSYRWISWTAVPDEELIHAVGRDITTEKVAAEELTQAQEALRQSQKMEAVGQLTGGLAHDFNNLLTGMMGNLELLQHRIARGRLDDVDRLVSAAQGAGRRAAALTQRLLAFSRRQTLDPKPTNVNRLITGMEEMLRRTVGPTTDIEIVGAAGLWTAMIDPGQLENALLNLCINARDAMPDGGKITVETENKSLDDRTARERDLTPGQYLSICVTDTGTGMTPATIERAFEPFFTTKPIGQGTGLGLSMIYGFARQSGGQVRIDSELGIGTTICVYLPRHLGDATDEVDVTATNPTGKGRGETILVVDDEATIRHLLDEILDELGYTVIGAADGAAGLRILQSGARIDLLITDVGLPNGMNGRQVADAGRAIRPDLKVMFITGYADNAAVGNGHLEPGMELLTKPFSLDDLTQKVMGMLGGTGEASAV